MKKISVIILMVGFGFSLFAQSGKVSEDKRKEFEAQKGAFFTQEMDLTPEEAQNIYILDEKVKLKKTVQIFFTVFFPYILCLVFFFLINFGK